MKAHTEIFGPEFKELLERDASIGMRKFLVSEVALNALLLAEIASSELAEDALKFIPILGLAALAAISAGVTSLLLTAALAVHDEIAQKTIVVVNVWKFVFH